MWALTEKNVLILSGPVTSHLACLCGCHRYSTLHANYAAVRLEPKVWVFYSPAFLLQELHRHTSAQSVVCWPSRTTWGMLINMGWYVYVRSHVFTAILRSSLKIVLCHQCLSRWLNVLFLRMLILRHDNHISIQNFLNQWDIFCFGILISLSHLYFVTESGNCF